MSRSTRIAGTLTAFPELQFVFRKPLEEGVGDRDPALQHVRLSLALRLARDEPRDRCAPAGDDDLFPGLDLRQQSGQVVPAGNVSCGDAPSRHQLLRDYVDAAMLRDMVEPHDVRNVTSLRSRVDGIGVGTPALGQSTQGVSGRPGVDPGLRPNQSGPTCAMRWRRRGPPGAAAPGLRRDLRALRADPESYKVDFLARDATRETKLIQVCADLSDAATATREWVRLFFVDDFLPIHGLFSPAAASRQWPFRRDSKQDSTYRRPSGGHRTSSRRRTPSVCSPSGALRQDNSRGVLVRCRGKGGRRASDGCDDRMYIRRAANRRPLRR